MHSQTLPDGLEDALVRVIARQRIEGQREIDRIAAEARAVVAESKADIVELKQRLLDLAEQNRKMVADAVANIRNGMDGQDGAPGRDGIDGKDGAPGRDGIDGKDGEPGADGREGAPGRDGIDGMDGAAGERGEPGTSGKDGPSGLPGVDGRDGQPGGPGAPGRDGLDGKDGSPGINGKDGFSLEDFDIVTEDDGRTFVLSFQRGDVVMRRELKTAAVLDRGVWKDGNYLRGDGVTWGGSFFIAQRDTDAKPETPDSGWRLAIKRGQNGKDGKPGQKGDPGGQGPRGEPGPRGYGG
jgi:integrin beta 3